MGEHKAAVIVANGSSVDRMPDEFWRACSRPDVLLVGTNRALCFRSLRSAGLDAMVIRDTYRDLWCDQRFGEAYHRDFWKPADCWKVGPADRRVTHCDQFVRQAPGWQFAGNRDHNGEAAVMKNSSVAIMAANWAWLQGAREIYLIGVDYHGPHAAMIEPYAGASVGWEGNYDRPVPAGIERQFARAVSAVESAAGVLRNLSDDSRLAAVGHADWPDVFNTTGPCRRNGDRKCGQR